MEIREGLLVCFDYELTLDDGEVIDSSEGGEPLCYLHGQGGIIPGLEKALEGMNEGEQKDVMVPAKEAYGEREPELVERLPREAFPDDLEVGMGFRMRTETGQVVTVFVESIGDEWVEVNFSHPLAGKDLYFHVEITEVREPTEEDLAGCGDCGSECGCGDGCDDEGCGHGCGGCC